MVTIDYDGVSTHLMIILMIELGIWVIRACANFIRRGDTFQGKWSGLVYFFGDVYIDKGRCQKPQARKLSVGGVTPPRGLHGREFSEKLAEKI